MQCGGRMSQIASRWTALGPTSSKVPRIQLSKYSRAMATVKDSIPHVLRTADDPRQAGIHRTILSRVELVNQNIRVLRLSLVDGPARHLPGQYVDLHIPEVETVGGFTITSPPIAALASRQVKSQNQETSTDNKYPFIELAIQRSPNNPPAAYLYRNPPEILDTTMHIRIGGSFTYPPYTLDLAGFKNITNVVFIAGGVGINPIMSMLSAMDIAGPARLDGMKKRVRILYSSKRQSKKDAQGQMVSEEILFESRLRAITKRWQGNSDVDLHYTLFETTKSADASAFTTTSEGNFAVQNRRITHQDLLDAVGSEDLREHTLIYVCGHPSMTDEYVEFLRGVKDLNDKRVLCEKWW